MASADDCFNILLKKLHSLNFNVDAFRHNRTALVSLLVSSQDPNKAQNNTEYHIEALVENQRGLKVFGMPLFSRKSLIPYLDPPLFMRLNGKQVRLPYDSLSNFVLPDFGWKWSWTLWYVLMMSDVDELGWHYLNVWGKWWHGKYRFGDTVRRRVWIRMREKESLESINCL